MSLVREQECWQKSNPQHLISPSSLLLALVPGAVVQLARAMGGGASVFPGQVYEGAHMVRPTVRIVASFQLFISENDDGTRYVSGSEQFYPPSPLSPPSLPSTPRELWPRTPDSEGKEARLDASA